MRPNNHAHAGFWRKRGREAISVSDLSPSGCDISPDHTQVIARGFKRLLGIMARNKSCVIIKGCIALPAETIKDDQQPSMFLVDARSHEIDDGDVVPRLTSRTESMAEHEPERRFEHCFVSLLKASLLVKGENFVSRGEFLVRAREKAFNLRPINDVRLYFLQFEPTSGIRLLCQTFSRNASLRARRDPNSFRVSTV